MANESTLIYDAIMSGNEEIVIPDSSEDSDVQILANNGDDNGNSVEEQILIDDGDDYLTLQSLANDIENIGSDIEIWSNSGSVSSESDSRISSSTAELENSEENRPELIYIDDDSDSDGDVVCVADMNKKPCTSLVWPDVTEIRKSESVKKLNDKIVSVPTSTVVSGALSQGEKYYKILLDVLPEANEAYLREEASKIESTEDLHFFINKAVSEENYPRKSKINDAELTRYESKFTAFQKEVQNAGPTVAGSVIRAAPSSSSELKNLHDVSTLETIEIDDIAVERVPRHSLLQSTSVGDQLISVRNVSSSSNSRHHMQNVTYDQPAPSTSSANLPIFVEKDSNDDQFKEKTRGQVFPSCPNASSYDRASTWKKSNYSQSPISYHCYQPSSTAVTEFPTVKKAADDPRRVTSARNFLFGNTSAQPTPGTSSQDDFIPKLTVEFCDHAKKKLEEIEIKLQNTLQAVEAHQVNADKGKSGRSPLTQLNDNAGSSAAAITPAMYERWYNSLRELLPDADPRFLIQETRKLKSYDDLHELIIQLVPGDNYPTKHKNDLGDGGLEPNGHGRYTAIGGTMEWSKCYDLRNRGKIPVHLPRPPHSQPPPAHQQPTPAHQPAPPAHLPPGRAHHPPGLAYHPPTPAYHLPAPAHLPPAYNRPAQVIRAHPFASFAPRGRPPPFATRNHPHPQFPGGPPLAPLPPGRPLVILPFAALDQRRNAEEPGGPVRALHGFLRNPPMLTIPPVGRNASGPAVFYEKYQRLLSLIPQAHIDYVGAVCEQFNTLAEIDAHARYALAYENYPKAVSAFAQQLLTLLRHRRRRRGPFHNVLIERLMHHYVPLEREIFAQNLSTGGSEMYKKLQGIFPDADQDYLEKESTAFQSEEDFKKFVLSGFAHRNYRRRAASQEMVEQELRRLTSAGERHSRLLTLLPDAHPSYIIHMSSTLSSLEEVEAFAAKAASEKNYPKRRDNRKRRLSATEQTPPDPRFLSLKEMLPDADPEFLEKAAKKMKTDQDIESFVLSAVEAKNYPKMDAYLKRREYQDMWRRYIQDFNVEEYLALFPDPITYFYFEKKGSKNMPAKFLLHRYGMKTVKYLNIVYEETKNSITRTCDRLDYEFSFTPKKLYIWDGSTQFDVTVLQEVAFIQNKREIAQYILSKKEQKELAFAKAKENGELVECSCCYDEHLPEDIVTCPENHIFCISCLKRGSEVVIGEGKTSFPCYNDACEAEFPLELLKNVLCPDVFSRLLIRKQYEEVKAAGIPGLETCPFCEFCSIPDATDKVFRCLNPQCMKITCRNCKKAEHLPLTCEEMTEREETEAQMKKYVEEKMTEALVRSCYNCHTKFIKEDGCNLMKCRCGAKMCYVCHQAVTGYDHFDTGRCQLYVNLKVLHVKQVIEEGKKAKQDMEAANPGIRLENDPTVEPEPL